MDEFLKRLTRQKKELEHLPLPKEQLEHIKQWQRVELTYNSNALEGNTLSRQETALVVEKKMSVAGKTINETLEALNHAQALDYIWQLAQEKADLDLKTILEVQRLVLNKIDDDNAGRLRRIPVRVVGSKTIFPNYVKIPTMMKDFVKNINASKSHVCLKAAEAHLQLVSIHPFVDGNGRTARLLMNLVLLQAGWPLTIIHKEDRLQYLNLLEGAQTEDQKEPFYIFIFKAIERSFDIYLRPNKKMPAEEKLIKIGDLARLAKESVSTLRYWSDQGLLPISDISASGYRWYKTSSLKRVQQIRKLQSKRLTIKEIKAKLDI